jgi:hypothetical protein
VGSNVLFLSSAAVRNFQESVACGGDGIPRHGLWLKTSLFEGQPNYQHMSILSLFYRWAIDEEYASAEPYLPVGAGAVRQHWMGGEGEPGGACMPR